VRMRPAREAHRARRRGSAGVPDRLLCSHWALQWRSRGLSRT